jgi:flagellar basal body rod protein FlgC
MEIQSAFNAGVQGFQKATLSANQAASDIAKATTARVDDRAEQRRTEQVQQDERANQQAQSQQAGSLAASGPSPSLTESIVNLKVSEFQAEASANVIRSADEALGTLIDVTV